jgi:formate-dependent nitrite reductase membrane component NrfD
VRFGSSSVAAGAAALALGERDGHNRRALEGVALAALAVELAATVASHRAYRRKGVDEAFGGGWGAVERFGATGLGVVLPMALLGASLARGGGPRSPALSGLASAAILAGSALLRTSIMTVGDESASRPEVSFRFSQPENLPATARRRLGGS